MKVGAAARLQRALEEAKKFSGDEVFWKIAHEERCWWARRLEPR